ncbi:MAG: hypothetical protein CVU40_17785 [Chloroflexi bacterium HGW-Chloroflexi-2]|nr:MAG: hypothetical protein CVU40_17785 [Chloroflexi bacterium HGW-Chloroflexi-2]
MCKFGLTYPWIQIQGYQIPNRMNSVNSSNYFQMIFTIYYPMKVSCGLIHRILLNGFLYLSATLFNLSMDSNPWIFIFKPNEFG